VYSSSPASEFVFPVICGLFVTHLWLVRDSFVTRSWLIRDSFVTYLDTRAFELTCKWVCFFPLILFVWKCRRWGDVSPRYTRLSGLQINFLFSSPQLFLFVWKCGRWGDVSPLPGYTRLSGLRVIFNLISPPLIFLFVWKWGKWGNVSPEYMRLSGLRVSFCYSPPTYSYLYENAEDEETSRQDIRDYQGCEWLFFCSLIIYFEKSRSDAGDDQGVRVSFSSEYACVYMEIDLCHWKVT